MGDEAKPSGWAEYEQSTRQVAQRLEKYERALAGVRPASGGRPVEEVREALLVAFELEGLSVWPEVVDDAARRIAAAEGWQWDWDSLTTLGSDSARVRSLLSRLLAGVAEDRQGLGEALYCQVANQGQLYTAAAACVDIIVRHVESGHVLNSTCVSLLESILNARTPGLEVEVDGEQVDVADYCRGRILEVLPRVLESADGADSDYFREFCFLVPQLADSSSEVLEFLRRASLRHDEEFRRAIADALEESEEVMRDGHMP